MLEITPSGETLGATVKGADLSQALSDDDFGAVLRALGRYGVLRFPAQSLTPAAQKAFAARFGSLEVNVAGMYQDAEHPEIMFLSNIVENGKPIGLADAGQDWHTDMSYSATIALANVLYAIKVPRDAAGRALGATRFANMHAAYDELPQELKDRLAGATAIHDFNKFWEMMRREKGSSRPALTEEQRRKKPPVSHPVFLTHPISGRKVLYANPGYTVRIEGMPEARKRRHAVLSVRASAQAAISLRAQLERRRPHDVGQYRHAAHGHCRLRPAPASSHAALPSDGRLDFCSAAGWRGLRIRARYLIIVCGISRMICGNISRIARLKISVATNQPQPRNMSPMEMLGATPLST